MEIKDMNLFEKLSNISNEIKNVDKDLNVCGKYNAVSEGNVLKEVKVAEYKYRVYSYPCNRSVIESGIVETSSSSDKKTFWERIETIYRFVNIDKPSEYIDITTYGDGFDNQDKSVGKAMTYADKYALLKAYKIITGDDPDQELSQEVTKIVKQQPYDPERQKKVSYVFTHLKDYQLAKEKVGKKFYFNSKEISNEDLDKLYNYGLENFDKQEQVKEENK